MFDEHTDPLLRRQILTYLATAAMTDAERARALGLPKGCRIREGAKILAPEKFRCGEYVFIGEGSILDAQGGLTVGDYTQLGLHVLVWTHSSHKQALHGETGLTRERIQYSPTRIGSSCFIGGPSVVLPGVTIGDRVIVPPMSVVDEDIEEGTVLLPMSRRVRRIERQLKELLKRYDEVARKQE
jgi:acetyltransferase-like isoleucine patch superfamily enzyme